VKLSSVKQEMYLKHNGPKGPIVAFYKLHKPGIDTHNFGMLDGRHEGERLTRVPLQYLKFLVTSNHEHADYALAEMKRRGTRAPTLDLTAHAIDRASLKCLSVWVSTRREDEGIHSWLVRTAEMALKQGVQMKNDANVFVYKGMKFVFIFEGKWPVLKTLAV